METPPSSSPWQPGSAVPNSVEDEGWHLNETRKVTVVVVSSRPPQRSRPPIPPHIRPLSSGVFECSKCGEELKRGRQLSLHINCTVPDAQKPHKCEQCGKGFRRKCDFTRHLSTHSSKRPFPCETCGKSFFQRVHLAVHSRTHSGEERPFLCENCGTGFSVKAQLERHLDTSHGEGVPLPCTKCNKKFLREESLVKHMKSHAKTPTGEMGRYACNQCGKTFRRWEHVDRHQKTVHSDNRPFGCTLCQKSFKRRDSLILHMKRVHNKSSANVGTGVIAKAQNVILKDIRLDENVCLLPLFPYCPALPPPPDDRGDDVECQGTSSPSQTLNSLSLNDANDSSIPTTSSSTPSPPPVVPRPSSPLPCSSSSVIGSGFEARIEEVPFQGLLGFANTSGKADTEEDLDEDIVGLDESGVARYETVETENHVMENNGEDVPKAVEVGLNNENHSNPSRTPAPSTPSSSSPIPCCSSSLGSGNIITDKDRVEQPNLGSCTGAGGMLGNQEEDDPHGNDVVGAEGVSVEREIAAEIRDENENVEESEGSDDDDIYNPDDFFDDDYNWVTPELNQAPDELSDEPVLTHTHHHRG